MNKKLSDRLIEAPELPQLQAALVRRCLEARGIDPDGLRFRMDMAITAYRTGKMVITLTATPEYQPEPEGGE